MAFAKNISSLLVKNNISSCKLAKEIGVHTTTVTNWKKGKKPTVEHLVLVANYFGCSIDELIR